MIDIKDISGKILLSVPITESCEHVEELMQSDHIVLSWNSDKSDILPMGAYIEYGGEKYSLLEPYSPIQKSEEEFSYQPLFKSVVMYWAKVSFFMYTYSSDDVIIGREPDWTLTDNPANFMSSICKAIKNETGETWTYTVDASLSASATLSFQSVDIYSSLNSIANAFETEWWIDKANKVIHLSKAEHGIAVRLEVGKNITVPTVTVGKEGYYTRFYAFGSTRNIVQDYEGANVNNLVNKRLTLDPVKYPNGYKDIRPDLKQGEIFQKILIFDNVYPSSSLEISDVRVRLMWTIGEDGEKVQVGTDNEGNPIYDQYSIWYFKVPGFVLNNTIYSKDNPEGMLISGKALSVHFESGALQGREFELIYHDKAETVSSADGTSVILTPGDYEIKFKEEGTYIIPAITSLIPNNGDEIILFNIRMPEEYTGSAYLELESEMNKEISRLSSDLNNYQFSSNPISFSENNPDLSIGRKITYVNGGYSFSTRVIKLVTKIDFKYIQSITVGNEKIKGNTQELKEEVISANKDINLLSVLNDMTTSLTQSYNRTQQMMLDGFAAIKNIWQFKEDESGAKYAYSKFPVVTAYGVTMYAGADVQVPSIYEGLPIDGVTIQWVDGKLVATGGKGTANGIVVNGNTYTPNEDGIITLPNYPTSLEWDNISGKPSWIGSTKPYYSWDEIGGKPSVFPTNWENVSDKPSWIGATKPTYDFSEIQNKPTTIAGYGITDAYTKNDISGLLADYVTKSGAQDITGVKSFINGLNIGDILVKKHSDGVVELDGDLILTGSLTMFAQGSHTASTILDALPIDNTTLSKEGDVLSVIGGVGGGSVDGIILNGTTYSPDETTKLITLPNYPTTLPASDVYSWAKQPNKPSYSFDELSSHPTTLGGYGITDAYTKHEINTTVYSKSECNEFFVNKAGDTMTGTLLMSNDSDIYGRSSANSGAAYIIGYRDASISGIVMHDISAANNTKALYIQTNGYDAPSDTGGLAITNDCVTAFGAGDNGSVFRVLNEDDVNLGALFNVAKDGTLTRLGNKIWDAGNDGSGSGLDADLLDGKHLGNVGDRVMRQIGFPSYNEFGSNDTNVYLRKVLGWCYNNVNTGASDTLFVGVGHPNALGNMQIQLYCADGINSDGYPRYSSGVFFPLDGLPSLFGTNDYNYYQHTLATTDGNVYSATKLQTPRTIFSKPFDGTNNVTGGAKFLNICIETDNNGNDSGRGSEINNYVGPLQLQQASPIDIHMCMGGGNVGIGTTSPSYKLSVNGDTYCSGKITSGNWIRSDLYSAGIDHYADDSYSAAYNACAPNNDNYCCYSIVRSGTIPLGIGFNTNSEIWLGTVNTNRKAAAQWLQISGNRVTCSGDILAYGGITMYGSDETKKNIIERFILPLDYVVNAPLWRYTWRDNRNDRINIGGSAQYTQLMMNELVGDSDKGLTMDYATTAYAFSVSIAKHFQRFLMEDFNNHETRIEFLERENKKLKDSNKEMMDRIIELERRAS
nr:MAG TPA: tail protein [Bacteriophage sp.]